jgi:hypothetical protein
MCTNFVSRSIITHINSSLFFVLGKLVMKSIWISSHFHWGIGRGCNNLDGRWCSALTLLQVSQSSNFSLRISPPKCALNIAVHFCATRMYPVGGGMCHLKCCLFFSTIYLANIFRFYTKVTSVIVRCGKHGYLIFYDSPHRLNPLWCNFFPRLCHVN